ncbi:MAG: stage V sporulation protein AE, partial [Clostridia bacterium]|nr:stage V sporulation protein AE [Clostridia bacterium]
ILKSPHDPVFVMVDDKGTSKKGRGEKALGYIAKHPEIEVLGVVAVASNTEGAKGALVDLSITKGREAVDSPVDKYGNPIPYGEYLVGDTVDVIEGLNIPIVVGIGDIGKMDGADDLSKRAPITTEAVREILRRSGYLDEARGRKN